ncbi:BMP family ABC transporter substrate-binding protein [Protaetiibacter larvae]|uniref:BMP family ABC transporter substrate-binding protein n=1 Tax=Protaetiibacter larvae TaxID=2592654 RepID=A0A5C1YD69_9MICO|nr:BMP family ABC transporter substrate-binding protein [Protaetiibacter larvae]
MRRAALSGLALIGASALVLSGCAAAPDETPDASGEPSASDFLACMVSDFGGFHDGSFNEAAYQGLLQAESDLGVTIKGVESKAAEEYVPNIEGLISEGCDIIVSVGFNLATATRDLAKENPEQHFALVDSALSNDDFSPLSLDNVKPLLFDTGQASFLAGYLAAGVSKTGTVATYGGNPYPSVTIFMEGYAQGVDAYNAAHGTSVKVLGGDVFANTFEEPTAGQTLTEGFIAQGADVIFPVAGLTGQGSGIAALAHDGVLVIGVDADWFVNPLHAEYKSLLLTSVLKGLQISSFEAIKAAFEGSFDATPYIGTLENDGVGLADFHDQADAVSAELQGELDALRDQIVSGELVITTGGTPTAG